MNWLGAEFAIAAVSDALMPVGDVTGALQVGTHWVPFPDERYRTVAVAWQRGRTYELATSVNQQAYRREAEQTPSRSFSLGGGSNWSRPRPAIGPVARSSWTSVNEHNERFCAFFERTRRWQIIDRLAEQHEQLARSFLQSPSHCSMKARDGSITRGVAPSFDSSRRSPSRRFDLTATATN